MVNKSLKNRLQSLFFNRIGGIMSAPSSKEYEEYFEKIRKLTQKKKKELEKKDPYVF